MSDDSASTSTSITPYLYYEDVAGALEWLSLAFGFREREQETMRNPEGKVVHAAMEHGNGVVLMGCPGQEYKCPKRLGQTTQSLYVYVGDVEQHFKHAKGAGATILSDPEDTFYGDRRYGTEDLEGHHWYFAEKIREMSPEEWQPSPENLKGHG